MNVTLPDGTTIEGVPDGTTKAQLFDKLKANGHAVDESWMKPAASDKVTQAEYDKGSFFEKVGGPKPGESRADFKQKVESVDMPFPDILPGGAMMANAVAREGGGLAGAASAIGKGAVNVGKDALNAVGAPIKYLLRGGESNLPAMRQNMATFQAAGAQPSVGQATGGRNAQAMESLLAKTPGGAGRMAAKATEQQAALGEKVRQTADSLAGDATPFVAGRTIEKGLTGFVQRFKAKQADLYGKVDPFFQYTDGSSKAIKLPETMKTLKELNPDIPGAPETSKFFKNQNIESIRGAVESDVGSKEAFGQRPNIKASNELVKKPFRPADLEQMFQQYGGDNLPYEAVKKIRSLVGEELSNPTLEAQASRSKYRSLYAALSKDMDNAAKATGSAEAVKAVDRANSFTRSGHDRIESVLDKVASRNLPEEVYKAATNASDMQAGASKIGTIMKSLTPEERDVVKSAFIRRMGVAKPGAQNDAGDVFSSQTFLTQWNQMSPQAKAAMFSSKDNELREGLDSIAEAASKIKEGSKVFANPSGTSPAAAQMGLAGAAGAAGVAAMTGHVAPAAALITGVAGANISARMMTNPKFVSWLAAASKLPEQQLSMRMPVLVNLLRSRTQGQGDDVKQDVDRYVDSLKAPGSAQPAPATQ